jgi:hypothetical protein
MACSPRRRTAPPALFRKGWPVLPSRRPVQGHLEDRVVPEHIAVVPLRVADGDRQTAEPDDLIERMHDFSRLTRIGQARSQSIRETQPPFDFLSKDDAAIDRKPEVVDIDRNRLAGNR